MIKNFKQFVSESLEDEKEQIVDKIDRKENTNQEPIKLDKEDPKIDTQEVIKKGNQNIQDAFKQKVEAIQTQKQLIQSEITKVTTAMTELIAQQVPPTDKNLITMKNRIVELKNELKKYDDMLKQSKSEEQQIKTQATIK